MSRVDKRPRAKRDLDEQAFFLEQNTPGAGFRFFAAAEATFEQLVEMPGMGRRREVSGPGLQGLRSWRIKGFQKWLIFYRPIEDGIEVIRVLHGAQDIGRILETEDLGND